MSKKAVHQKFNNDALTHFGMIDQPFYGLVTSHQVDEVLITQDETTFDKIRNLITKSSYNFTNTPACGVLKGMKRAFVLPRCGVSLDRVKAACKEHKITITNDYTKADFIISHDDIYDRFENGEKIKTTSMMFRLWNYEAYEQMGINYIDTFVHKVIYDSKLIDMGVSSYNLSNSDSLYDEWGISGLSINLAYLVDTGELTVIDVDTVLKASANITELTPELIKDMSNWLDSYDNDNIAIAGKILPTIDYTKKKHLMWELAQNLYHKTHKFTRDKDVNYWLDQSRMEELYHMSAEEMILYLEKSEELNKESFKYLEPIVRKEISINNRNLYVFKVSVKKEYKKYLQ
tara:strand:- start:3328 stop:4365 length:1038 start_codon:yes stop_codon:yes gene_type:complete